MLCIWHTCQSSQQIKWSFNLGHAVKVCYHFWILSSLYHVTDFVCIYDGVRVFPTIVQAWRTARPTTPPATPTSGQKKLYTQSIFHLLIGLIYIVGWEKISANRLLFGCPLLIHYTKFWVSINTQGARHGGSPATILKMLIVIVVVENYVRHDKDETFARNHWSK